MSSLREHGLQANARLDCFETQVHYGKYYIPREEPN